MADAVKELLSAARASEARGEPAAASEHYLKAGFPEEAARVLMGSGQHVDAGRIYVRAAEQMGQGGKQDNDRRRLLRSAAVCFARGGDAKRAVELFVSTGDTAKAIEVLERSGDRQGAARLRAGHATAIAAPDAKSGVAVRGARVEAAKRLEQEGRLELALEAFVTARQPAEAARVARKLERHAEAAQLYDKQPRSMKRRCVGRTRARVSAASTRSSAYRRSTRCTAHAARARSRSPPSSRA